MDLDQIREKIDHIDQQLVVLLEERMTLVECVVAYKKANDIPIVDQIRERALLENIADNISNRAYETTLLNIFTDILSRSKEYQSSYFD